MGVIGMRKVSLQTRKPCNELKVSDFAVFPIWEFALDEEDVPGRDETWVRPINSKIVPKGAYDLFVAATFTTASGRKLDGCLIVNTAGESVEIGEGIVLGRLGYRAVPRKSENKEAIEERKRFVALLGQSASKVFPIHYKLQVVIEGEESPREGIIA